MSRIANKVIIPKFMDSRLKYFIPRFAKIQRGESIQWTNLDDKSHRLVFYEVENGEGRVINILGPIEPNKSLAMNFQYDTNRIDYYCDFHGDETGIVIIFSQNEETMTNTQRLRFLSKIFNINPPDILAHLRG